MNMNEQKIHVLGIAPYETMKTVMQKIAEKRPEIELDVYVGDLKKGVEIARQNLHRNYDIIISRGGTAEMIGKSTNIPVIEVGLSVYDILRAIKLAENYTSRYAIIGFPSITKNAHILCDLLQYKIDIISIHSEDEVPDTLKMLKQDGYRMILCDAFAYSLAKQVGLNAILITSGNESIENAFDNAVKICSSYINLKEENRLLGDIIHSKNSHTIVFDSEQKLYFSTWEEDENEIIKILQKEIPEALNYDNHKIIRNVSGNIYYINSRKLSYTSKNYVVFYLSSTKIPFISSNNGILFSSKYEMEENLYNSFYGITGCLEYISNFIDQASQCNLPIMITGEEGTGKKQAARIIYIQSLLSHNPLITINCNLINDKSWDYITNHDKSPLNDNNNTIYFESLDKLSESRRKQLLSLISEMDLCNRNRMIFSCTGSNEAKFSPKCMEFVNMLSCLTLYLRPLRDCADQISALSSLYLSSLNVIMAKQIIGFEPQALELLKQFSWPGNHNQLSRGLNELALLTTTPYISTKDVLNLMNKGQTPSASHPSQNEAGTLLDLNQSLDDITKEIIQKILTETGGNQSAAAKWLGISRTTLWRYLKQ